MATVTLQGIRKVYSNGHVGVARADLTIADGELLVLVGPSGCGKSTLLRIIAGLEEVSEGTLMIGERDVTHLEPRDRDIAMVFQSYALYPHMTVERNLGFGLKLRGVPDTEITALVQKAAGMLDLSALLQRLPKQLSGGQRQRVALGRAMVRQPQVFLLDEPLSNLDAKLRSTMRTEIARLHRSLKTTMIYVTHDQVEAMTLGQRIVVMNQGVIQQIDAPMRIYDRPVNLFVAGFLGNPSMNLFRGILVRQGAELLLKNAAAQLPLPAPSGADLSSDREIVLGVRPESLRIGAPTVEATALRFNASVELVESIGNEAFVHARLGDWPVIARAEVDQLPPLGADITLQAAASKLHFFDAASGQRLEA